MFKHDPFGEALDVAAQVTGGVCPTCTHKTVFVSLSPEIFRCMNCGADCKQYVNGQIRYLPAVSSIPEEPKDGETTKVRG
tara:strand:- start:730 stop:969 length:240 start_codon:yes stop_codon:yes gene_type:complete